METQCRQADQAGYFPALQPSKEGADKELISPLGGEMELGNGQDGTPRAAAAFVRRGGSNPGYA